MSKKFHWAVALYIISFFMPVVSGIGNPETTIWGWQVARESIIPDEKGLFSEDDWMVLYYLIATIPNPLIVTVIILKYTKVKWPNLIYAFSLIAMITALFWSPFFFSQLLSNFDMGYWFWLLGILLIYYYVNEGSMKRPSKRSLSNLEDT